MMGTYLLTVMGSQNGESWHGIDRKWLGDIKSQRLGKEGYASLCFTPRREELPLEPFVTLRHEEGRSTKTASAAFAHVNLMVQKLLDMVDGEEMLAIHRDDDSVPNLRYQHLPCHV